MIDGIMNAYIMDGGMSSRMGQDKNFLTYKNGPFLSQVISIYESVFDNVKLVAKDKFFIVIVTATGIIAINTAAGFILGIIVYWIFLFKKRSTD